MSWGGRANPRATKSASRQFDVPRSFTAKFAVKLSGGSPKKKATSIRCMRPIAAVIRRFPNKSFEREPSMKPVGTPFPAVCKNRQKPMLPTTSVADMSSRRGEGTKGKWRGWLALHPSRLRRSISAETNAWFSTEQLASSVSGPQRLRGTTRTSTARTANAVPPQQEVLASLQAIASETMSISILRRRKFREISGYA